MQLFLFKSNGGEWYKGVSPTGRHLYTPNWNEAQFYPESYLDDLSDLEKSGMGHIYCVTINEPCKFNIGRSAKAMNLNQDFTDRSADNMHRFIITQFDFMGGKLKTHDVFAFTEVEALRTLLVAEDDVSEYGDDCDGILSYFSDCDIPTIIYRVD